MVKIMDDCKIVKCKDIFWTHYCETHDLHLRPEQLCPEAFNNWLDENIG